MKPWTVSQVITDILVIVMLFLCVSFFVVTMQYVKQLQISLRVSNESQATMLNGMHEGVLILEAKKMDKSDSDEQVLFCNWPA